MKKTVSALLAALLILAVLFSLPASAFAEEAEDAEAERDTVLDGAPGPEDIRGACNVIMMPSPGRYLDHYELRYVNSGGKNAVFVYLRPVEPPLDPATGLPKKNTSDHNAYHGSRVTVLAEQNGFSCALYYTSGNVLCVGWIYNGDLSAEFPGTVLSVGEDSGKTGRDPVDIPVAWSEDTGDDRLLKCSVLAEPAEKVLQFTLDYDIYSRFTNVTEEVYGPRTIYVNNGSEWVEVGSFDCQQLTPYHITVKLPEPMDITAIATSPDCVVKNFTYRQMILNIICAED